MLVRAYELVHFFCKVIIISLQSLSDRKPVTRGYNAVTVLAMTFYM